MLSSKTIMALKRNSYMKKWFNRHGYPKNHIMAWEVPEERKLIKLIEEKGMTSWFWVAKEMNRSPAACRCRYKIIRDNREKELKEKKARA